MFGGFDFCILSLGWKIGDGNLGRFGFILLDYLLICLLDFLLLLFLRLLFCYLFDFFGSPFWSFNHWSYCSGITGKRGGRLDRDLIKRGRVLGLGVGLFKSKSLASGFDIFVAFLHSVGIKINK